MTLNRRRALGFLMAPLGLTALPTAATAETYEYDVQGQIKKATYNSGTIVQFTYDGAGNRTWRVTAPASTAFSGVVDTTVWDGEEDLPGQPPATSPVVATPLAGTPEYSFFWQKQSGSSLIQVSNPNSSTTGWQLSGSPHALQTYTSVWRCRITDKSGAITYTPSVNVSVTRSY